MTEIATLIKAIETVEQLRNPSVVKSVIGQNQNAIYFSRSPVPYVFNAPIEQWLSRTKFYEHVGLYAYRADILEKLVRLDVSILEKAESLEQLRWLENGFSISVAETTTDTICIDTPEDLQRAERAAPAGGGEPAFAPGRLYAGFGFVVLVA